MYRLGSKLLHIAHKLIYVNPEVTNVYRDFSIDLQVMKKINNVYIDFSIDLQGIKPI